MSRLNPKRRRKALQAALFNEIVRDHGPSHDDSHKLQRGSPRTSASKYDKAMHMRAPNFANLDSKGPAWYKDGAKNVYQGDK